MLIVSSSAPDPERTSGVRNDCYLAHHQASLAQTRNDVLDVPRLPKLGQFSVSGPDETRVDPKNMRGLIPRLLNFVQMCIRGA